MSNLIPTWYSRSIYDIDIDKLKENNIKYILSDLDNTLVGYDIPTPNESVINLVTKLKENNINLLVISNNSYKRLKTFSNPCSLNFLSRARKPGSKKLANYLKENNIDVKDCVFVGDQLLTDMWCANKLKCKSILVDPLQKKESIFTFFNRLIDKKIRKRYHKQGRLVSIMKGE